MFDSPTSPSEIIPEDISTAGGGEEARASLDALKEKFGSLRSEIKFHVTDDSSKVRQIGAPSRSGFSASGTTRVSSAGRNDLRPGGRRRFFSKMRASMEAVFIEHARQRKPQHSREQVGWDDAVLRNLPEAAENTPHLVIALFEALAVLRKKDEELSELIDLSYLFGFSVPEIAEFKPHQEGALRMMIALSLAAAAVAIPGFFEFKAKWKEFSLRTAGPLAVFAFIFLVNPAMFGKSEKSPAKPESESHSLPNSTPARTLPRAPSSSPVEEH